MEQDTYQKDENDLVDSVEKLMENYNIDSGEIISILIDRTEIDLDEIEKAVNEIREKKNELNWETIRDHWKRKKTDKYT